MKENLQARNISVYYGPNKALHEVSLDFVPGRVSALIGPSGCGKSTFLRCLNRMNDLVPGARVEGEIVLDGEDVTRLPIRQRRAKGVGYISEDRMTTGLALQANADENLICGVAGQPPFSRRGILRGRAIAENTAEMVRKFDIRGLTQDKPVRSLSGGNMQKIVLAREISRNPKLLIAAQPTRGLDIGAINFVREHLLEQKRRGTAILLVSADLEELMSLSDRMIILYEGRCSGEVTDIPSATEAEIGLMMGGITSSEREAN